MASRKVGGESLQSTKTFFKHGHFSKKGPFSQPLQNPFHSGAPLSFVAVVRLLYFDQGTLICLQGRKIHEFAP